MHVIRQFFVKHERGASKRDEGRAPTLRLPAWMVFVILNFKAWAYPEEGMAHSGGSTSGSLG
jgi:hypothetical protein